MEPKKEGLRLAAFILDIVSIAGWVLAAISTFATAGAASSMVKAVYGSSAAGLTQGFIIFCGVLLLLPLAWCIPLTINCWKAYQDKRANTTALGVVTLIFVNLISGILLLCATKETKEEYAARKARENGQIPFQTDVQFQSQAQIQFQQPAAQPQPQMQQPQQPVQPHPQMTQGQPQVQQPVQPHPQMTQGQPQVQQPVQPQMQDPTQPPTQQPPTQL